jgi:ADP-ribose pyrophosphatase
MSDKIQTLYRGKIIRLDLEQTVLPNGVPAELEIVRHPGGAAVVAVDAEQKVCLLRQYRPAFGDWFWELPAGKIDHGEPPRQTAQRELQEEAGLQARHWRYLGAMIASPGVFTEVVHCYLATGLRSVASSHEAEELIEIHWLPLEDLWLQAIQGAITDAKTVIGLCRARAVLDKPSQEPL